MLTNEEILDALEYSEIAGGSLYDHDITGEDDANVVVRSRNEFTSHCGDRGKVVWVPGNERIDLSGWSGTIRATIASDRGIDGSDGALIYTDSHGEHSHAWDGGTGRGVLHMRDDARLTGVRYRGPYHDYYDDPRYPGYIPLDSGSGGDRARKRRERYARGMKIYSDDVEIDNCELYGWSVQAIHMGSRSSPAYDPHIHHIHGHDCMMVGFGYVIDIMRGHPTIEKSYFDATRHSVDGFGFEDAGYTLEDCVFGPSTYSHAVDMHCLAENGFDSDDPQDSTWGLRAGDRMEIRNCTFCFREDIRGNDQECIAIRGVPKDGVVIERNRFMHDGPPSKNAGNGQGDVWRQGNVYSSSWGDFEVNSDGFTPNFIRRDNQFDAENAEWEEGYGASINLLDPSLEPPERIGRDELRRRKELLREIFGSVDDLVEIFK